MIGTMTQADLERLLKESQEIARDWDTYVQFRRNRDAILEEFMPDETLN